MALKWIKLKNFKSHTDSKIEFTRFTCIIGMNGSGKSNVFDAICYILGYDLFEYKDHDISLDLHKLMDINELINENEDEMMIEMNIENKNDDIFLFRGVKGRKIQDQKYKEIFKINHEIVTKKQYINFLKTLKTDFAIITQNNVTQTSIFNNLNHYIENVSGSCKYKKAYEDINMKLKKETHLLKTIFKKIKLRKQSQRESELESKKRQELDDLLIRKAKIEKYIFIQKLKNKNDDIESQQNALYSIHSDIDFQKKEIKLIQTEIKEIRKQINKYQVEYVEVKNKYKNILLSENEDFYKQKEQNLSEMKRIDNHILNLQNELKEQIDENGHKKLKEEYYSTLYKFKKENYKLLAEEEIHRKSYHESQENKNKIEKLQKVIQKNKKLLKSKSTRIDELKSKIKSTDSKEYESLKRREKELNETLSYFLTYKHNIKVEKSKAQIIETLQAIFPGVKGKISTLIKPTQQKYFLAIESLLTNKNTIIVDTKETALKCIKYLESKKLCRLTFFCINSFKNIRRENEKKIFYEMAVQASNCVTYDDDLSQIVDYLFHNCYILLDNSKKDEFLLRKDVKHIKLSTLQGTLFQNNYITGGPITVNLDADIISQLNQISEKIRSFDHISIIMERIEDIKEEIKIMNIENGEMNKEIDNMEERNIQLSESAGEFDRIKIIVQNLKAKRFKKFLKNDFNDLNSLENFLDTEKIQTRKKEILELINGFQDEKSKILNEINQLNFKIQSLENEKKLKINFQRVSKNLQECRENFELKRSVNKKITADLAEKTKKYIHIKDTIERIGAEKDEIIQEALMDEIIENDLIDESDFEKENIENQQENLKKSEIQLSEINSKIDEIYALCSSATTINHSEKKELEKYNEEYEKKKKETKELREAFRSIRKQRVDTFYSFYNSLCDMLTQVMAYFNQVAQLTCLNKVEPYLKEVKYYIMKEQFSVFELLSGGEKALAMVGFILSVNLLYESPFCLFDEIDAALDHDYVIKLSEALSSCDFDNDLNISGDISINTSKIAKESIKKLQIICISHKKEFFSHADSLIGIYKNLNESKILGYKLN